MRMRRRASASGKSVMAAPEASGAARGSLPACVPCAAPRTARIRLGSRTIRTVRLAGAAGRNGRPIAAPTIVATSAAASPRWLVERHDVLGEAASRGAEIEPTTLDLRPCRRRASRQRARRARAAASCRRPPAGPAFRQPFRSCDRSPARARTDDVRRDRSSREAGCRSRGRRHRGPSADQLGAARRGARSPKDISKCQGT